MSAVRISGRHVTIGRRAIVLPPDVRVQYAAGSAKGWLVSRGGFPLRFVRDPSALALSLAQLSVRRNPSPGIIPYEEFKTGLSFPEVRRMMWSNSPDPKNWRHKGRHSVLGLWHELKGQMYDVYEAQNEPRENPRRPARAFMRSCVRDVKRKGQTRSPGAVCASQFRKMTPAARRAWESMQNPGIGPGTIVRLRLEDPKHKGQAIAGLWRVSKVLPGGRLHVTNGRTTYNIHRSRVVARASNPALPKGVALAARNYKAFHWGEEPKQAKLVRLPTPKGPFWELGSAPALPYATKKGGEQDVWEHGFEGKKHPRWLVDSRGEIFFDRNGSRFRVKKPGITG